MLERYLVLNAVNNSYLSHEQCLNLQFQILGTDRYNIVWTDRRMVYVQTDNETPYVSDNFLTLIDNDL